MATKEEIIAALAGVAGPDGTTPLPQSGALSDVLISNGRVTFAITGDPARSAELETMRLAAERAVKALPGVNTVLVMLTAERAAQAGSPAQSPVPSAAGPGGRPVGARAHAMRARTPIVGVDRVIAVASGKGGVGKSTTAANLALALAAEGLRVGILDADIYGPSMPRLFGLTGKPEVTEGRVIQPLMAHGIKIMSMGFLVSEQTAMVWRGPMVAGAVQQLLREVAWEPLDVLVVDMPPGTGDAQLTLAQSVALSGAVIVSTPQDLALIDARRGVEMFRKVDAPILGIVENMSMFICPNCGTRHDIFGHGGARKEAARIGVPFLGEIPLELALRETSDSGKPIVVSQPDGAIAAAYRGIARRVKAAIA
ncbi:ATP-binding protein involved in chromosome partitioning [Rhizobiales bacterium GAS191]|nr:ATP-binding protein involved in chromosome partitioning [Rhizobiales bacterium GAS191]SEE48642.1 ATP-binding protein involved in chromosome partitioning [Rhizobiales bacterium GAS188]